LDISKIVADLKSERDRLSRAISALEGAASGTAKKKDAAVRVAPAARKGRRGLTSEGRKKLSEAMKQRWAERKRKA
jgi:hypothetical protein